MAVVERFPGVQFSLQGMLWLVAAISLLLVGYKQDAYWAAAIALIVVGAAALLKDCLPRSPSRIGSAQLLLGAALVSASCGLMFGAAYVRWTTRQSGMLDYVTFAMILFAACYGFWIRSSCAASRFSNFAFMGYFAWITGAFMLNHVLFESIIRRLR